jgi:hypothetical protein
MMLAGARLANLIETIFETNTMFLQRALNFVKINNRMAS